MAIWDIIRIALIVLLVGFLAYSWKAQGTDVDGDITVIIEAGYEMNLSEMHILAMLQNDSPGFGGPAEMRWTKLEEMRNWTVKTVLIKLPIKPGALLAQYEEGLINGQE